MLNGWKLTFCFCVLTMFVCGLASSKAAAQNSGYPNGQQQSNDPTQLSAEQRMAMQAAQQQAFDQQNMEAAQAAAIHEPQRPFPELPQNEQQYLEQMLDYWETSSQKVKQYVCDFQRYEYDSGTVNYRDPNTNQLAAATFAKGVIKYAEPDKGFYETTKIMAFDSPPAAAGEEAKYKTLAAEEAKEKWICDGKNVYEYDYKNKKLYESELPADMRGDRIIDSPMPFLFGAKKAQILDRYWVRVVPQDSETEYYLEAYPKRIDDARLYSKIEIVLAREDFLPKAMHVYSPQYNPAKGNFQSRYFAFNDRSVNDSVSRFQNFFAIFIRPKTDIGWKRVSRMALQGQQAGLPGADLK